MRLQHDPEPRGVSGLIASGQRLVAASGALPAVKGGSGRLKRGVRTSSITL